MSDRYGSRTKAAAAISQGLVLINGKKVSPSYEYKNGDNLQIITAKENFVSLGGFKLKKALDDFGFSVKDKIFADIGASTGGFTDCLLQNGAKKVYCIDVGESQLDKSLICDKTVIIDNYNARYLEKSLFFEPLDGVVIDVSFISLTYILRAVSEVLDDAKYVLALIKPQFECESRSVGKNGIVKGSATHKRIINKIIDFASECGLAAVNLTEAPVVKGKNVEYLILLKKGSDDAVKSEILLKSVKL